MAGNVTCGVEAGHADDDRGAAPAGDLVGLQDRLGEPDHLERVVGAATAGGGADLLDRVALGGVDEVGGAELLRGLALHLHRVDGEDPRRAGDASALDHRLADTAAADDRHRRPGLDLRGVERGADAGGDAASDERELLVGQVASRPSPASTRRRSSRRRRCRARSSRSRCCRRRVSPWTPSNAPPICSHRCDWSCRQKKQLPHAGMNDAITRSPLAHAADLAARPPAPCPRPRGRG